jgi:hypothetical protein
LFCDSVGPSNPSDQRSEKLKLAATGSHLGFIGNGILSDVACL